MKIELKATTLCCDLLSGTGKWILSAIVDSRNKDHAFFIGPDLQRTINAKLQAIAVPHDMERKPRSLEYIKRWKGKFNANSKDHYMYMHIIWLCKGIGFSLSLCLQSVQDYNILILLNKPELLQSQLR